jgi:hypothetical protein
MAEGVICIEMSTNCIGMKCNKNNIEQCFWDKLQSSIQSTPADWFPINMHVIFNDNLGLVERLMLAVVYVLQFIIADFTRVFHEVAKTGILRIVRICLDPKTVRWKPQTNCAVDKCLNGGCQSSILLWQEEFTVTVMEEDEVGMNLLKYPTRRMEWHFQAEFVLWMWKSVGQFISEPKATSKFKW